VQRDELMLAKASGPCFSRISVKRVMRSSASSQDASRKLAVVAPDEGMRQAIVGVGELMGEAALHAGVAEVGGALR
jgi:hypothetical protein